MPQSASATAVLRSEQVSTFEFRDKMFYATDPALGFARAIPVDTFLRNFEGCAKAIMDYHASIGVHPTGAEIIQFRKRA